MSVLNSFSMIFVVISLYFFNGGSHASDTLHVLTLEVTNDNFHGVHRLEPYIVAFKKNHCIANTGRKNINKIPLCC